MNDPILFRRSGRLEGYHWSVEGIFTLYVYLLGTPAKIMLNVKMLCSVGPFISVTIYARELQWWKVVCGSWCK